MDKSEIAARLESLCDRPFADDPEARAPALLDIAGRVETGPSQPDGPGAEHPGRDTAALASILSGSATAAQCQGFQEAAVASSAVRLDAQSALAFVEGIEQAPLRAPAHLVEQVLASAGGQRSIGASDAVPEPGIWSRISGFRLGVGRGRMVAACMVLIMGGGLSWSLLLRPSDSPDERLAMPPVLPPKDVPFINLDPAKPAFEPAPILAPTPAPAAAQASSPIPAPTPAPLSTSMPGPAQALADPCEPRTLMRTAAGLDSPPAAEAAKRARNPQPKKTADASPTDSGCVDANRRLATTPAAEPVAGRNPKADQGPVRAARPASQIGVLDRTSPAAALSAPGSAPAARPPSPAKPSQAIQPAR